ncbi:LacI family DNA-binding transcriptional regulator [Roseateles sp. BYS78W]|uniref:LacI family DNA-binding transcriptional regulator n=1 Tax=Pelomonas candidula TaxID=3299025 RepID=A0ABW7HGS4_9BURK
MTSAFVTPRPELRAKLHDVAREAGVSLATVDRALNQRPGVSTRTLLRVQEALQRLALQNEPTMAPQPRGGSWLLCFLLPSGQNSFVEQLREALRALTPWLTEQHARVEVRTTDAFSPAAASAAVRRLRGQYDAVVLMLEDHPLVRESVDRMAGDGTCIVTLVSDIDSRARNYFVGIDNRAAGRTAATLLGRSLAGRSGPVGIVMGSHALHDHAERLQGFREVMAAEHPALTLLPPLECKDRPEAAQPLVAALLAERPDLAGLYSIGAGNDGIYAALRDSGAAGWVSWVCHELTPQTRAALLDGTASAVIGQSAAQEAQVACRLALSRLTRQRSPETDAPIRIEIYLKDNLPP